jgi:hypothetical protein
MCMQILPATICGERLNAATPLSFSPQPTFLDIHIKMAGVRKSRFRIYSNLLTPFILDVHTIRIVNYEKLKNEHLIIK